MIFTTKNVKTVTVGLELAATMVAAHGSTQQWYAEHPANAKALLQVCRNNLKANVAMSEAERAECQRASNAQHFECSVEVTLGQRRLQ